MEFKTLMMKIEIHQNLPLNEAFICPDVPIYIINHIKIQGIMPKDSCNVGEERNDIDCSFMPTTSLHINVLISCAL